MAGNDFITYNEASSRLGAASASGNPDDFATTSVLIALGANPSKLTGYTNSEFVKNIDVSKSDKHSNNIVESIGFKSFSTSNPSFSYNLTSEDGIDGSVRIDVEQRLNFELFIKFKEGITFQYPSDGSLLADIPCTSVTGNYLYLQPTPASAFQVSAEGIGLLLKVTNYYKSGTYTPNSSSVKLLLSTGQKNVSLALKFVFVIPVIEV